MILYLDNAATSFPKPKEVIDSVQKCLRICGNAGRSEHKMAMESANQIYLCRQELSDFFDYNNPENVIFTLNATYALNIAINALYEEGTHVLISDLEHNAVYRPIQHLASQNKITYSIFSHKGDILSNIKEQTKATTKLIVCTHASNVTGQWLPIKEIGDYCAKNNIKFIIDGSQSAGHHHINLGEINFSAFCAPAHKGLLGIQGCGFAIINTSDVERDFILGGTGTHSFLPHMPLYLPDRYEAGTLPTPAICGLRSGIAYLKSKQEALHEIENNTHYLHEQLKEIKQCRLVSKENLSGIASFTCEEQAEFSSYCAKQHICIRSGFHCAPLAHQSIHTEEGGCIRVSIGIFTRKKHIDQFLTLANNFFKKHSK